VKSTGLNALRTKLGKTMAHLPGCSGCKGDSQTSARIMLACQDSIRDAMGNCASFTCSGSGQNNYRTG
jgi:hypothetical protein